MDGIISQLKHFSCGEKIHIFGIFSGKSVRDFKDFQIIWSWEIQLRWVSYCAEPRSVKMSALKPKDFNWIGWQFRQHSGESKGFELEKRLLELVGVICLWCAIGYGSNRGYKCEIARNIIWFRASPLYHHTNNISKWFILSADPGQNP